MELTSVYSDWWIGVQFAFLFNKPNDKADPGVVGSIKIGRFTFCPQVAEMDSDVGFFTDPGFKNAEFYPVGGLMKVVTVETLFLHNATCWILIIERGEIRVVQVVFPHQ